MKLKGKVFTGEGKAADFLQLRPYRDFITRKIGRPFPGTLNLRVDKSQAKELKQKAEFHRLEEFTYNGDNYGGLDLYLVESEGKVIGLIEPDRTRYEEDVVELVAEEELRKLFSLRDGDCLEIKPFKH